MLERLTTSEIREALVAQSGSADNGPLGRALAELGSAQSRLQTLDDDYYVRGSLTVRRYRSIRTRLEREVERLHSVVDRASKERVILHPDPRQLWAEADFRQRRELLRLIVERVDVMPARRGARFDPSRIRLEMPLLSVAAAAPSDGGTHRHSSHKARM
ncbi:MAG: hypothetical protein ABR540_21755 [Acidimicrobiales bacterium]